MKKSAYSGLRVQLVKEDTRTAMFGAFVSVSTFVFFAATELMLWLRRVHRARFVLPVMPFLLSLDRPARKM